MNVLSTLRACLRYFSSSTFLPSCLTHSRLSRRKFITMGKSFSTTLATRNFEGCGKTGAFSTRVVSSFLIWEELSIEITPFLFRRAGGRLENKTACCRVGNVSSQNRSDDSVLCVLALLFAYIICHCA